MVYSSIGTSNFTKESRSSRILEERISCSTLKVSMEHKTVKCPFCFKESQHGVSICTGCHATITYGECPGRIAVISMVAVLFISWLAAKFSGSDLITVITFLSSLIIFRLVAKKAYSDRVLFSQR